MVDPALLIWARESIGLDVPGAAKKIRITPERLEQWEAGLARPTIAQLRKAATAYKRPLAVFYLPEPPVDYQVLSDYRRLPESRVGQLSPELHAAIRHARWQREAALELRELEEEPVRPAPRIENGHLGVDAFAKLARDNLDVTISRQLAWQEPREALAGWIAALNALDVMVLHAQSIPVAEMRGFSITEPEMPVIVLNGADFARARIFTLLHEFAHLLLNSAGVCDLHERKRNGNEADDVEVYCNRVAAAILMPTSTFSEDPLVAAAPADGHWDDARLRALSERYSVSQEAVVRRLYSLDLTTWSFLQQKQAQYRAIYEDQRSETEKQRKEKPGGPTWYRMHVRDLGRSYIRLALDAYYRDDINASELADYVEVKLNKLPKLEEELAIGNGA